MGKSLNLSMLQKYIDSSEKNDDMFVKTKIYEQTKFTEMHMNKHPTIYLKIPSVIKSCKNIEQL